MAHLIKISSTYLGSQKKRTVIRVTNMTNIYSVHLQNLIADFNVLTAGASFRIDARHEAAHFGAIATAG